MSKSHANVLTFDENASYLSNLLNERALYERKEHFLNETTIGNTTNIGTIDEFMMRNQRTYVENKHRLEDLCRHTTID